MSAQLGTGVLQVVRATWNWSAPSCARSSLIIPWLIYQFIPLLISFVSKISKQVHKTMECGFAKYHWFRFLTDVNTTNRRFLLAVGLVDFTRATQVLFSPVLDKL